MQGIFMHGRNLVFCLHNVNAFLMYMKLLALWQTKILYLHVPQLLFSVLLRFIADIGVFQGGFVAARNYESVVLSGVVKDTIAGILSLLGALACALSGVTQVTFETLARVLLGFL